MNSKRWAGLLVALAAGGLFTVNQVTKTITNINEADSTLAGLIEELITDEELAALDSSLTAAFKEAVAVAIEDIPSLPDSLLGLLLERAERTEAMVAEIGEDVLYQGELLEQVRITQTATTVRLNEVDNEIRRLLARPLPVSEVYVVVGDSVVVIPKDSLDVWLRIPGMRVPYFPRP